MTESGPSIAAGGTPFFARLQPVRIIRQDVLTGIGFHERRTMPGPPALLAIRHFQRPCECQRMRSKQDGKRRQPLRVLIRDLPCEAGTPIVADEMETPAAMAIGRPGCRVPAAPGEVADRCLPVVALRFPGGPSSRSTSRR
jgi:hypothetical protein